MNSEDDIRYGRPTARRGRSVARFLFAFVLTAVAAGAITAYALHRHFQAPGPLAQETILVVPSGAGLRSIARELAASQVVESELLFVVNALVAGAHRDLKAGEYAFPAHVSPREALLTLREGRTLVRSVTIPEGLTSQQVVHLLAAAPAMTGSIEDIPADGSLLPASYDYRHGDRREAVLARMREAQQKMVAELWPGRAPDLPFDTPEAAVTLASIVEKETAKPEERARVAAVFVNRLRLGMRLQSDPTVVYALTAGAGPLGRRLTRADLAVDDPYNTYANGGLPPGPISNPGRDSLRAVLNPESTNELYFVADGTGGHMFAATLQEHNRNVARWRRLRDGIGGSVAPDSGSE